VTVPPLGRLTLQKGRRELSAEAYRKGDIVAVVHFRENGRVYGHTQRVKDTYVSGAFCFQMDAEGFARSVAMEGVERYDLSRLPALYPARPAETWLDWGPSRRTGGRPSGENGVDYGRA
jgi:hypothetical protein